MKDRVESVALSLRQSKEGLERGKSPYQKRATLCPEYRTEFTARGQWAAGSWIFAHAGASMLCNLTVLFRGNNSVWVHRK